MKDKAQGGLSFCSSDCCIPVRDCLQVLQWRWSSGNHLDQAREHCCTRQNKGASSTW